MALDEVKAAAEDDERKEHEDECGGFNEEVGAFGWGRCARVGDDASVEAVRLVVDVGGLGDRGQIGLGVPGDEDVACALTWVSHDQTPRA